MKILRLTRYLHAVDVLVIGYFAMLSLINIAFASRIPYWWHLVLINGVITTGIWCLAYARQATGWKVLRILHDWHVAPTVFFSFKELYFMIKPIHMGRDYDDLLIRIDHWLFGVNPTEWLLQFSHPVVTEVLQIAYTAFYLLFIIVGYELYRRGEKEAFRFFLFTCVYGFYLSYLGYFLLPAVGPRFTLHDFAALDRELPGLWLTPALRWFVNAGESIPTNIPNAVAIAVTQRDVFPSGHTMMTLVLIVLSARYRLRTRYLISVLGALLIVATVYQRYHYVVDLLAGALFTILCLKTARPLYRFVTARLRTREDPPAPGPDSSAAR